MGVLMDKMLGSKTWDVGAVCNGILGGMVYFGSSKLVLNVCKVDDPLDAFAVHGACGFFGCIATALFSAKEFAYTSSALSETDCDEDCGGVGLFYGCGCLMGVTVAAL